VHALGGILHQKRNWDHTPHGHGHHWQHEFYKFSALYRNKRFITTEWQWTGTSSCRKIKLVKTM